MSLLVTFVLLDGQIADNASFDCLTKSLKDSRSKIGSPGDFCTCGTYMEISHLSHPKISQEDN